VRHYLIAVRLFLMVSSSNVWGNKDAPGSTTPHIPAVPHKIDRQFELNGEVNNDLQIRNTLLTHTESGLGVASNQVSIFRRDAHEACGAGDTRLSSENYIVLKLKEILVMPVRSLGDRPKGSSSKRCKSHAFDSPLA
jgi:hypothetical protein